MSGVYNLRESNGMAIPCRLCLQSVTGSPVATPSDSVRLNGVVGKINFSTTQASDKKRGWSKQADTSQMRNVPFKVARTALANLKTQATSNEELELAKSASAFVDSVFDENYVLDANLKTQDGLKPKAQSEDTCYSSTASVDESAEFFSDSELLSRTNALFSYNIQPYVHHSNLNQKIPLIPIPTEIITFLDGLDFIELTIGILEMARSQSHLSQTFLVKFSPENIYFIRNASNRLEMKLYRNRKKMLMNKEQFKDYEVLFCKRKKINKRNDCYVSPRKNVAVIMVAKILREHSKSLNQDEFLPLSAAIERLASNSYVAGIVEAIDLLEKTLLELKKNYIEKSNQ